MRVIHTVPSIAEEASGPSYSVRRLCEASIDAGVTTTLAALDWAPMALPPPFLRRFPLGLGPRRLGRSPAMYRWLLEQAGRDEVDVIHTHGLWMMPNVYPGWVARRHRIALMISPRGAFTRYAMASGSKVKQLFWPLLQKPALLAPTICFHATAESEHHDIRRMGFRQPVVIIPNGIDEAPCEDLPAGEMRTLLYLGRIHPEKGVECLLRAWREVDIRFPQWRLRIVGPGEPRYVAKMKALAEELGLERCEFAGPLYGADKRTAYRNCDSYVLPSPSENFAMTVAEALMAGRPVITTRGAPWRDLETRGAGWWIDLGVDALVACLEDALSRDRWQLQEMGRRGREWMQAEFSWAEVARKMAGTYQWMLQGGDRPGWIRVD